MDNNKTAMLDPCVEFESAIYSTWAEWSEPVQVLLQEKTEDLQSFWRDAKKMQEFMRKPMLQYWAELNKARQQDLRHSLQYLLNHDEPIPYITNPLNPDFKEKRGGVAQYSRNSCQEAVSPDDGYALCQWMWEILFRDEDWHTDISDWVIVGRAKEIRLDVPKNGESPSTVSSFITKLFGKK